MAEARTTASLNGEPTVLLTDPPPVRHQHRGRWSMRSRSGSPTSGRSCRPATRSASCATCRSSSRRRSTASKSTSSSGRSWRRAVVLVFLWNWRSTLIAAIAIPTSIIATFGLIWYQGFTLNSMTMLALTLAVGIVIDDAIVVLENIYRFVEEKGRPPMQAAVEATREIGLAVLATTLSLIAIFVPVGFMGGIVGRFMKSFGFTMSFAILVSLLVSFTLTPMLAARWIKMKPRREDAERARHRGRELQGLAVLPADRSRLHGDPEVVARPSRGDCRHRRARAAQQRAAVHDGEQELPPERRPVGVRGRAPRAGGHEPRGDGDHREPAGDADPPAAGGRIHSGVGRRRPGADAEPGHGVRPAEAARRAVARSVRGHGRGARERAAADRDRQPADRRAAGGHDRRRRQPERRDPVHHQRAGPEGARRSTPTRSPRRRRRSPASSTSTRRSTSASRSSR